MPVAAFALGPVLGVGPVAVGEVNDPVLQQVALGIGLNVNCHIFVVRGLAAFGIVIVVFSAVRTGECCRAGGAGLGGGRGFSCHFFLLDTQFFVC